MPPILPRPAAFPCGESRREAIWEMGAGFTGLATALALRAEGLGVAVLWTW